MKWTLIIVSLSSMLLLGCEGANLEQMQRQSAVLTDEYAELRDQVTALTDQRDTLASVNAALAAEIEELKQSGQDTTEAEAELSEVMAKLEGIQADISSKVDQVTEIGDQIFELNAKIQSAESEEEVLAVIAETVGSTVSTTVPGPYGIYGALIGGIVGAWLRSRGEKQRIESEVASVVTPLKENRIKDGEPEGKIILDKKAVAAAHKANGASRWFS